MKRCDVFLWWFLCVGLTSGNEPLEASTFLGGIGSDRGLALAVDMQGNIIVVGRTSSYANFPITTGAYDASHNDSCDVFIAKFDAGLTTLLASTFIGGSGYDDAHAVAVDAEGNIYVAGNTNSSDFPTTANAYDGTYNGGDSGPYEGAGDVFVCKLDGQLTTLLASTFIGGTQHEYCRDMVLYGAEDLVLSVTTSSTDFPTTTGAYDRVHNGGTPFAEDAAVVRMKRDLSSMTASTFLGGSGFDFAEEIAVDESGHVFLTGWTMSNNFPTTAQAYDPTFHFVTYDAFVSRLDGGLSTLEASTFFGGRNWDFGMGLCLWGGHVYITGHTASGDLPTTPGAHCRSYQGAGGEDEGDDAFVAKFSGDLSSLLAGTYLGGGGWENGTTIACDGDGRVIVGGTTNSENFPVTPGAYSNRFHGGGKYEGDGFLTRLDAGLAVVQASTYLGGVCDDHLSRLVLNERDEILLAGSSCSLDWPTLPGAFEDAYQGGGDAVISWINSSLSGIVTDVASIDSHPVRFGLTGNFPNPFNAATTLCFELPAAETVTLRILDVNGSVVRTLAASDRHSSGKHRILWDGMDDSRTMAASGTYFCRLDAGDASSTMKLLYLR